jgi:hypothetical protein
LVICVLEGVWGTGDSCRTIHHTIINIHRLTG